MAHLSAFTGGVAPEAESKIPPETLRALRCNANFAVCEIFFTETAAPLAAAENTLLQKLIGATGEFCAAAENAAEQNKPAAALIIPHFGMVSPWSSKASELLKHCGLDSVRRIERGIFIRGGGAESAEMLADRMTQTVLRPPDLEKWRKLFAAPPPRPSKKIGADKKSLARANAELGLALGESELAHLRQLYARLKRAPTEAELIMFANANSEHCRHKIFRAKDGGESLMDMIRKTHAASPDGVITAFSDNAAIIRAAAGEEFAPDADGIWRRGTGGLFLVAKAETHNHPTAISPFSGAATGGGGEIRDEAAAGRGAATRAGFAGFIVSRLSGLATDLAATHAPSPHFASPLQIMIDGPLGAAEYCNEFGRPSLGGFFRTFESAADGRNFGFHKPLMLAGGLGHMRAGGEGKKPLPPGTKIIQLGGPGFRIGMGGGAASSRDSDGGDFASVQRGCADMQRRAQEVIDVCRRMPGGMFLSLHDVGAGGLANAVIEMVHEGGAGARISLSAIPVEDRSLSPAEIWCNESQERYVLALAPPQLEKFAAICARESCPFAVIGETAADGKIVLADENGAAFADLPLAEVLDGVAIPAAVAEKLSAPKTAEVRPRMELSAACRAVLRHPATACKRFLISIGDRTVGGLTARDQMVGPWQTPVADCAAFFNDYDSFGGAAFALGERPGVAALNPAAGARIAVAEALSNLAAAAAGIGELRRVKFSLNWLANCSDKKRRGELGAAVSAAADFCMALKTGVVVGKDSMFMRADGGGAEIESPAFAVAAAFAPSGDVRRVLTPQLSGRADSFLMIAEPSGGRRLGGGVFAEISGARGAPPDIAAAEMRAFWRAVCECHTRGLLAAYHDRSDGGLWAAACEMAFAANCGISLILDGLFPATQTDGGENGAGGDTEAALFCEEIGALLEVAPENAAAVLDIFAAAGLAQNLQTAGHANADGCMRIYRNGKKLFEEKTGALRREWEKIGYEIARRRDCPECAAEEYGRDYDADGGLFARPQKEYGAAGFGTPFAIGGARPRVAVLREQGSNGQREMAAAFTRAGFDAADVPMSDLRGGQKTLGEFAGLALCGGFSFGDVLGAGCGWAAGVLQNPKLAEMFAEFFADKNTFTYGACNGCQALSFLRPLMPNADAWYFPRFAANRSRRFEARFVVAEILKSPSIFFSEMDNAFLPVASSNGEGRPVFEEENGGEKMRAPPVMRFAGGDGKPAAHYPQNPAGDKDGMCGFCSPDGRITITMPHPERVFRCGQMSWRPPEWKNDASPWLQMFINARRFIG